MKLKELKNEIREIGGTSCDGIAKWIAELTHPAVCEKSAVEISADGKQLLVWYYRTPGAAHYELSSHEFYMLKEIVEVPMSDCIVTPNGIRLAA